MGQCNFLLLSLYILKVRRKRKIWQYFYFSIIFFRENTWVSTCLFFVDLFYDDWLSMRMFWRHTWLLGCPNPYGLKHSWESTFLKVFNFSCTKTIWAQKNITCLIQNYQLSGTSNSDLIEHIYWPCYLASNSKSSKWKILLILLLSLHGWRLSEKCTPTLLQFVRVRAAYQPHVL